MSSMNFPVLQPDDIEVRVAKITRDGCQLLLYKTARTDMYYLDEVVGPENWKDEYTSINGMLMCTLSICRDGTWISKMDVGEPAAISMKDGTNAHKSMVSDALKRAGTKWGIGRELYSSPFIWAKVPTEPDGNKFKLKNKFQKFFVREIGYDDKRRINKLVITDDYERLVYSTDKSKYPFAMVRSVIESPGYMPDDVRNAIGMQNPSPQEQMQVTVMPVQPQNGPNLPPQLNVAPTVRCESCNSLIVPAKAKDGGVMRAEDIIAYSKTNYMGRVFCTECMRKYSVPSAPSKNVA